MADPQTTSRPPRRERSRAPIGGGARREMMKDRLIESRLTPNAISITGLILNVVAAVLVWQELYIVGGIAFIVGSVCDTLDGRYSRMSGKGTQFGAFLDSTLDRVSDGILFGCLFWALAGQGHHTAAILALSTLSISLEVSQIRAEGEALGVKLSEGVFQRLERYVALMVGLTAPGALLPVLAILTALGGITIAQRVWSAWRGLSKPQPPAEQPLQAPATS